MFLSSDKQIVNIENQYYRLVLHNFEVHVWIISFSLKIIQSMKIAVIFLVPSPGGYLNPTEGFLQFSYMGLLPMIYKPLRLLYVNLFLHVTIDKVFIYIHLVNISS